AARVGKGEGFWGAVRALPFLLSRHADPVGGAVRDVVGGRHGTHERAVHLALIAEQPVPVEAHPRGARDGAVREVAGKGGRDLLRLALRETVGTQREALPR